jgi:hypothetical protein
MIDRFIYKCFAKVDDLFEWIEKLFTPKKQKKKNGK